MKFLLTIWLKTYIGIKSCVEPSAHYQSLEVSISHAELSYRSLQSFLLVRGDHCVGDCESICISLRQDDVIDRPQVKITDFRTTGSFLKNIFEQSMVQSYIQCIQDINEPVDALTNFCDDVLIIHSFN